MGIQNLMKLVNRSPGVYLEQSFNNSRLVIDGSNLLYHLYFSSGLEQNRGGEYGAFEDLVEQFIHALRECTISPYVVFDGSDLSDERLETVRARAEQRIQKIHCAAQENRQMDLLPALIWEVYRQTLCRLKVPIGRSYTEADQEAVALAQEWNCPVLSNDTDFYVFPLTRGVLPTSHFRWQNVQNVQNSGCRSIPCKMYYSSSFCSFFSIQTKFLPVFAVLAGNDLVRNWMKDYNYRAQYGCPELERLLDWLKNLNNVDEPQDVFVAALRNESQEKREELLKDVQHYSIPRSSLSLFFSEGTAPPLPQEMEGKVPDWMRLPVTQVQFSSDFLDVLTLRRISLSIVVDHKDKPSSNLVSRPLRRVLYALLLGGNSSTEVEERDRDGLQLKHTRVTPASTVPPELNLDLHRQTDEAQRLQVLLNALGVNKERLSKLPSPLRHLSLPLAVTCYWLQEATPPPPLLKALLIGWCKGDDLRHKAGPEHFQMFNVVFYSEAVLLIVVRLCSAQDKDRDLPWALDLDWCHWLNQWQACLKDGFLLNQLLGKPLPEPTIAGLYNGRMVHLLLHKMKSDKLDGFVQHDVSNNRDYHELLSFINPPQRQGLNQD